MLQSGHSFENIKYHRPVKLVLDDDQFEGNQCVAPACQQHDDFFFIEQAIEQDQSLNVRKSGGKLFDGFIAFQGKKSHPRIR